MSFLEEYVFAGFGGQGVLTIGAITAYAAMKQGYYTSWFPSYGPESRGGTCNCTVMVSDEPIGSPHCHYPNGVIAMSGPAFEKFEPRLKANGLLLVNSDLVSQKSTRSDIQTVYLPCAELALTLDEPLVASVVALGAFTALRGIIRDEMMEQGITWAIPRHRQHLVPVNIKAYHLGKNYLEQVLGVSIPETTPAASS